MSLQESRIIRSIEVIFAIGLNEDQYSVYISSKIKICNQIAVFLFFLGLVYCCISLVYFPILALMPGMASGVAIVAIILNHLNKHQLSRFLMGIGPLSLVFFYHAFLVHEGEAMITPLYLSAFGFALYPWVLSDIREKRLLVPSVVTCFIFLSSQTWANQFFEIEVNNSVFRGVFLTVLTYFFSASIGITCLYFMQKKNLAIELERDRLLEKTTSKLQKEHHFRKQSEKIQLDLENQLELRLKQLAENSTDWIWEVDENNIYIYSSPGVTSLLGYSPEEILGKSVFDLMSSPEKENVANEFFKSKNKYEPFTNLQNMNRHKDGHLVTIESSGSPVFNSNGEFKGYRGIDRDISDRKKLEDELRQAHKMESIGIMAGGIAHDFNNILGIIVGNAELALDSLPDWNPSYNNLKEIKTASLRAKDIVRQLLSFSRKTEQIQKPLDIKEVIKESIKLIRSSIPSSIKIHEEIPEKNDIILADATQIHQILINLCTNASYTMLDDGGLLEIILRSKIINEKSEERYKGLSPGNYIELIVKDSGSGIDPKICDKIFDPYFTTKAVGKGTGMGLAVVHGIVKNHQGKIYVDSELGKGTTFRIVFPTITEQPQQTIETTNKKLNPSGNETILFVDDEEALVEMAKKILEKLGYSIQISTNPIKALAIFEADPTLFDLVISDMTMPQMSGVKLSEKLREIQADIPIIICTGHSSLIDEGKAKNIGISAYAMKPITMSEIAKLIRTVLDK